MESEIVTDIVEANEQFVGEVALLQTVGKKLARKEAKLLNLKDHRQLNIICLKSPNEKVKISLSTENHWLGNDNKEENEDLLAKPKYLQISWLDTSDSESLGKQIRYQVSNGKVNVLVREIKSNHVEEWLDGDTLGNAVYQKGDWKHPDKTDLDKINKLLEDAVFDQDFQKKVVKWPSEQWVGLEE